MRGYTLRPFPHPWALKFELVPMHQQVRDTPARGGVLSAYPAPGMRIETQYAIGVFASIHPRGAGAGAWGIKGYDKLIF